jgi:hypothetical protein
MCRYTVSVGPDGTLYDCDFNQMLGAAIGDGAPMRIHDLDAARLRERSISWGSHCAACVAGAGSSCTGALVVS